MAIAVTHRYLFAAVGETDRATADNEATAFKSNDLRKLCAGRLNS